MKEKLKTHKLVSIEMSKQDKLVSIGKLKQKGLAFDSHFSMGKFYYWVKRGQQI
jgi:hypothetical protein